VRPSQETGLLIALATVLEYASRLYDEQRRKRFNTVEIIVEVSGWSPPEKPEIVGLRDKFQVTHADATAS
jgi:hypothetical protein